MSRTAFTFEGLCACLMRVEPVQLRGMVLLEQHRAPAGFFPTGIPRGVLVEATRELLDYAKRTQEAAHSLAHLAPTPLTTLIVEEYGL